MVKELILNILKFLTHKVENDQCSKEELDEFANIANNHLTMYISAEEVSELFGQNKHAVHANIQRNRYSDKLRPKRKVLYNFMEVLKILPKTWFKKK